LRYGLQLILLGAVQALSFAPNPLPALVLPYVQIVALACLAAYVFTARSPGAAAWTGFLFGLGQFCVGLYWIFISLHRFGGLAAPLAAGAVLVLAAGEALFFALAAAATQWLTASWRHAGASYGRQLLAPALWASCWAGAEWLRGTLLTGFPWLNTGYAHADGPLAGWAPLFGVYGLAWFAAFIAAAIAQLKQARGTAREAAAATAVAASIAVALAGLALGQLHWSSPSGAPILVRLVQGNVPQSKVRPPIHAAGHRQLYAPGRPAAQGGRRRAQAHHPARNRHAPVPGQLPRRTLAGLASHRAGTQRHHHHGHSPA